MGNLTLQNSSHNDKASVTLSEVELPFLSAERERELIIKYGNESCRKSAHEIMVAHEPLVKSIASKYRSSLVDEADLCQEARVGMKKALDNFSPEAKNRFNTFARHYIRAEVLDYLISNSQIVKTATTKAQRKLFFNSSKLNPKMSMDEVESVACELNVKSCDVIEMTGRLSASFESIEANTLLGDELLDDSADVAEVLARNSEYLYRKSQLESALKSLPERERDILESRWLFEKKVELSILAKKHNLSSEGVRVVEKKALALLKKQMLN